jgi:hypothetical protein
MNSKDVDHVLLLTSSVVLHSLDQLRQDGNREEHNLQLDSIWECILKISKSTEGHARFGFRNEVALSICCLLCDHLVGCWSGVPETVEYWTLMQMGLTHPNSAARKRSRYLFRKTLDSLETEKKPVEVVEENANLFLWSPDHSDAKSGKKCVRFWNNIFTLFEVLEEKQVHVIKPVLPRLQECFTSDNDWGEIHVSWMFSVLKRGLAHESRSISRWAILTTLGLAGQENLRRQILTAHETSFLFSDLLAALNHEHVFSRWGCDDESLESFAPGERPPVGAALGSFLFRMSSSTENQVKSFFMRFLTAIKSVQWGQVQLVYVSEALSEGEFHDQGDAKWIVIRVQLRGHNDTPCGRPAPGRPIGPSVPIFN